MWLSSGAAAGVAVEGGVVVSWLVDLGVSGYGDLPGVWSCVRIGLWGGG